MSYNYATKLLLNKIEEHKNEGCEMTLDSREVIDLYDHLEYLKNLVIYLSMEAEENADD